MWLKRIVGISMILAFGGLNTLVIVGLFKPQHTHVPTVNTAAAPATISIPVPTVSMSVNPAAIAANGISDISWTTTGSPDSCTASGNWDGDKTIFGAENTGRLPNPGTYSYTLTCKNAAGSAKATTTIAVTTAPPAASHSSTASSSNSTSSGSAVSATYCSGRSPCYGKADVAKHGSAGNCWGYNIDRVIDVGGFDAGYHVTRSGISSIQVSSVCGKDLSPALSGAITVEGQTGARHNSSTRSNQDANEIPYFVGYFDANKS